MMRQAVACAGALASGWHCLSMPGKYWVLRDKIKNRIEYQYDWADTPSAIIVA
jgi:hypothetical protein